MTYTSWECISFVLWTVETQSTLAEKQKLRLSCVLYKLRFQSIEFNRFRLFSLWFPKHYEQLFHLKLCFYDVMQLNRALSTQSADGIVKGCLPFPWLLSDRLSSWSHLPLYCPHRCVASPEVAFCYSFLPWDACVFSAYACSSGSVFPDISLSSLFSFLLSMVCITLVLHIFGLFYPFGISYMLLLLWRKSFRVSNTLLDIDAEMIEQLIWVKEQIFLEIFFPFIILKLKLLKLKSILKTLSISTWFLKDSCAE